MSVGRDIQPLARDPAKPVTG